MAAGRGPAGIAGVRAARSRPALLSACSLQGQRRPTRALRPRQDCAGTTPTQATSRDSGTPASRPRTMWTGRGFYASAESPRRGGLELSRWSIAQGSVTLLPKSSLFAKLRGDRSTRFIFVHGFANGREEGLFADLIEQSESLQFVLHRILEFGKAQLCLGMPKCFIQF